MNDPESLDSVFREAVSAIDAGDVDALERLLAGHPRLAHERLTEPGDWLRGQIGPSLDGFFRDPYLLWLLTEDAVRTGHIPDNVAALAHAIVRAARRAGADNVQEQLDSTLHFAICSPVGREDGRQIELIDALLEAGASIESTPMQALICCNFAAAGHLLERGAILTLPVAVCLERWEDVERLGPTASADEKQIALALAALNGRAEGLARLLPFGVEVSAFSTGFYTHATPLHHAVWSGSLAAVRVLVEAGARLDIEDTAHGATPLGWADYALSLRDMAKPGTQFAEIAEYLRAEEARRPQAGEPDLCTLDGDVD